MHPGFTSQVGSVRASAREGNGVAYTLRGDVAESQYHFLLPATTVNIAPGFANVSLERWVPAGTHRTIEVTDSYLDPTVSRAEIDELLAWDSQVAREDVALVESVQRGLDSGAVPQGRLMVESERLIADFQRRVHDALTAAG